jgi:hypothetical protein
LISARTVRYHTRTVFTDLAISSRGQLHQVRPADPETGQPHQPATQQRPGDAPPGQDRPPALRARRIRARPPPHNDHSSKQSRTGKHQAGRAIGRVHPLAAGTESEDHNEHDQHI